MLTLYHGRSESAADRLEKEIRTYDFLDKLGIEYDRADHMPAMTMEDCDEIDAALGTEMCKNLFLCNRQCTQFYLLMIPGKKKFRTKDVSGQLGTARLSFADGEHMEKFLDITPGSLSVMGLMNDSENNVRLLIDRALVPDGYEKNGGKTGVHPCVNTSSLAIKTSDLIDKIIPAMKHDITYVELPEYEDADLKI